MERRRRMTVRIVPLDSREAGDPRMDGSVEERVAAVDALTREAWRLAGRTIPSYTRATMPVAIRALRDDVEQE